MNKTMYERKNRRLFIVFLFLCLIIILLYGCQLLGIPDFLKSNEPSDEDFAEEYALAENAYFAEDFSVAARIFGAIVEQTKEPDMARKALFGHACALLMLADTQVAFEEAVAHWNAWAHAAPRQWAFENSLFFTIIVNEKIIVPGMQNTSDRDERHKTAQAQTTSKSQVTWSSIRLKRELDQSKKQLEKADQKTVQLQKTIRDLRTEIAALKDQIKAFELIDQKIEEKKTTIPSTE